MAELVVHLSDRAAPALAACGAALSRQPVEANLLLTLLTAEAASDEPGRHWWAAEDGEVVGVLHECPLGNPGVLLARDRHVAGALADAAATSAPDLGGVQGSAGVAAAFAGRWTERTGAAAAPVEGERLYRLDAVIEPRAPAGRARLAEPRDVEVIARWADGFAEDTGHPAPPADRLAARVDAGRVWVWEDEEPVAMAMVAPPAARASRVGLVYTPPAQRGRGLASALVAACSAWALAEEADVCLLFTQLANPTSNGVYRRLGYVAVDEVLRYAFTPRAAR